MIFIDRELLAIVKALCGMATLSRKEALINIEILSDH